MKIWRFIDFWKYENMLKTNELYFTRGDVFDDILEGSFTKNTFDLMTKHNNTELSPATWLEISQLMQDSGRITHFVNCWHMNEESDVMWKRYTHEDRAVAILSTFKKLTQCFETYPSDVFIGEVEYIDHETDKKLLVNPSFAFFHKGLDHKNDEELRALVSEYPK